jgi:hypothetical protein
VAGTDPTWAATSALEVWEYRHHSCYLGGCGLIVFIQRLLDVTGVVYAFPALPTFAAMYVGATGSRLTLLNHTGSLVLFCATRRESPHRLL